jgi:hypothetical protein
LKKREKGISWKMISLKTIYHMAKDIENFRDQLTKLAEAVEILENTFVNDGDIQVNVTLDETKYQSLMRTLNYQSNDTKCIVSIGNVDFTFLKK